MSLYRLTLERVSGPRNEVPRSLPKSIRPVGRRRERRSHVVPAREVYRAYGGPDGGDGGRGRRRLGRGGGRAEHPDRLSLSAAFLRASGQGGMGKQRTGKDGDDILCGCLSAPKSWRRTRKPCIADVTEVGNAFCWPRAATAALATALQILTNRRRARANPGQAGVERTLWLRLKLMRDAGLLGCPMRANRPSWPPRRTRARRSPIILSPRCTPIWVSSGWMARIRRSPIFPA